MDEERGEDVRMLGDSEKVVRFLDRRILGFSGVIVFLELGY